MTFIPTIFTIPIKWLTTNSSFPCFSRMASVLHGNCLSVPLAHGHSHGGGSGGHNHSHSHNKPCTKSSGQLATLSPSSAVNSNSQTLLSRKDDAVLARGVINMHSTSIHTTHSRHNSFSKTLPNGGSLLDENGGPAAAAAVGPGDKSYTR